MEPLYVLDLLSTFKKRMLISQSHMLSCFMELRMYNLLVNFLKFIIQRFQLCMELNKLYLYFSRMFPKYQLWIRWLQLIRRYTNLFGSGVYHKPHYILKSESYEFHNSNIGLFSGNYTRMSGYFIVMHMCAWEKHFLPQFLLLNSTLRHLTQNSPK